MVQLDPSRRVAGPFADEWLPIRPWTDLAFFLALANVLIDESFLDEPYLTKFTNAPFLVKADGYFLKKTRTETVEGDEGEEEVEVEVPQVWDLATSSAKDHDADGVESALDGSYTVDGQSVRTGFAVFKDHVAGSTPEWAAEITGLDAAQIRKVALSSTGWRSRTVRSPSWPTTCPRRSWGSRRSGCR